MNLETGIQQAIITYLAYTRDVWFMRTNSFSGHIERRNGSRGYIKNSKPGAPDILLCYKGRFVAFEIKTTTGKQSDKQKVTEAAITNAGGYYFIVRSVTDAQAALESLSRVLS